MHEECQGSRSQTPNPHKDVRGSTREGKGHPSGMRPSCRTVRERAVVGSQRTRQTRRSPTSPQSTSQIYPGRATHNPTRSVNKRLWAYTRARNLRIQSAALCGEASKHVLQQAKKTTPTPLFPISKKHFRPGGMVPSEWTRSVRAVGDTPVGD